MTTLPYDDRLEDLVNASTSELLGMIDHALEHASTTFDSRASAKQFKRMLDALHAKLRRHHAVAALSGDAASASTVLTSADPHVARLNAEHSAMLGMLGHLGEQCYSVSGLSPDEQELFVLRVRELLAVFRRHKAEEDLLYYQTVWREVGGEG